jgi:CRISPR-associated protein Cas2
MVLIVLERVPSSVRGELTRWMLELGPGVFVGKVSAMVRDRLWEMVCARMRDGAGLLVHSSDTEQGFAVRFWGSTRRSVVDFDGLTLIKVP